MIQQKVRKKKYLFGSAHAEGKWNLTVQRIVNKKIWKVDILGKYVVIKKLSQVWE